MLALLSWLAAGAAVGLAVRSLDPDRQFLGVPRVVALGKCGGLLCGLLTTVLLESSAPTGNRPLSV
jgi:hypothetical protein